MTDQHDYRSTDQLMRDLLQKIEAGPASTKMPSWIRGCLTGSGSGTQFRLGTLFIDFSWDGGGIQLGFTDLSGYHRAEFRFLYDDALPGPLEGS